MTPRCVLTPMRTAQLSHAIRPVDLRHGSRVGRRPPGRADLVGSDSIQIWSRHEATGEFILTAGTSVLGVETEMRHGEVGWRTILRSGAWLAVGFRREALSSAKPVGERGANRLTFHCHPARERPARFACADIRADPGHAPLRPWAGVTTPAAIVEIGSKVDASLAAGSLAGRTGTNALPLPALLTGAARRIALTAVLAVRLVVDAFPATAPLPGRARLASSLALANLPSTDSGATLAMPMTRFAIDQAHPGACRARQPASGERREERTEEATAYGAP